MKQSFSISAKIWLSLSILVFGYLISMVFGFFLGRQTEYRLHVVSEHLFPATRQSELALVAFKEQIKNYDDAVVLGEPTFLQAATTKSLEVRNALTTIISLKGITPLRKEQIIKTISRYDAFNEAAKDTYSELSFFIS